MAKWSSICQLMKYANRQTEMTYQKSIKDILFEAGLDWHTNQIEEQMSMQMGASQRLIPDLVISKDNLCRYIVEIKKASNIKTKENIDQLVSYMKQLETPIGIYIGKELEVYYKTIGNGTEPILLMSLQFDASEPNGDTFVSLFSEGNFSVENIISYMEARKAEEEYESNVCNLVTDMTSESFLSEIKSLIHNYYVTKGLSTIEINEALNRVTINITEQSKNDISIGHCTLTEDNSKVKHIQINKTHRRNNGIAQRYAYTLIRQILEKNSTLNFKQLYAIFNHKNYIENINNIKDETRWCMANEDIIQSIDGIQIVISNQWGFNNSSKPRMDRLRTIAKEYGIDIPLPVSDNLRNK